MDNRYKPLTEYVVRRFRNHLGPRLQSIYIKGSVARGDAVWGVSDLDLVLAFERPDKRDNELKREIESAAKDMPGGSGLVIQRIGDDRLQQMGEGTRAYWLYSSRYDAEVVYGAKPADFLPEPPPGEQLVKLISPMIRKDGEVRLNQSTLQRHESRHLAKRLLEGLALTAIAEGTHRYIAPLEVSGLTTFPESIRNHVLAATAIYKEAPVITDPRSIHQAWLESWDYIERSRMV